MRQNRISNYIYLLPYIITVSKENHAM